MITVATEYYGEDAGRFGFMKIYLLSDYYESQIDDEEKIYITDYYETRFMSAYYPSADRMYAMVRGTGRRGNQLILFDWESGITIWPMRGLSEEPNASMMDYLGNTSIRSIIYAEQEDYDPDRPKNFPVKGYLVGGTNSIWAHSICDAP